VSPLWVLAAPVLLGYGIWGAWACTSSDPCKRADGLWGVLVGGFFAIAMAQEVLR
jgi:hypothetical protein